MVRTNRADVLSSACPSRRVLDLIADKWTALILYALTDGTLRYSELVRQVNGVSQKMLTQTLRNLERDGIVTRTVYPVVPPHVEYALTPLGRTLLTPLAELCAWAERHWSEVHAARERHEARSRRPAPRLVASR